MGKLRCVRCGGAVDEADLAGGKGVVLDATRCVCRRCLRRAAGGGGKLRRWLAALAVVGTLGAAAPILYRKYLLTPEGEPRLDLEAIAERLREIEGRAKEKLPDDIDELKRLGEKLGRAAGSAREELRKRGLSPEELKKKAEELVRRLKE